MGLRSDLANPNLRFYSWVPLSRINIKVFDMSRFYCLFYSLCLGPNQISTPTRPWSSSPTAYPTLDPDRHHLPTSHRLSSPRSRSRHFPVTESAPKPNPVGCKVSQNPTHFSFLSYLNSWEYKFLCHYAFNRV